MTSKPLPLPTISLSDRKNLSQAIHRACSSSGFFYLNDHGLSPILINSVFKASSNFFLNSELDSKSMTIDRENNVGYTPMMTESLDLEWKKESGEETKNKAIGDLKESFYLPRLSNKQAENLGHEAPTVMLTREFETNKKDLEDLIEGCRLVCETLLEGFAEALELPSSYFARHHHGAHDRLRLIHYPPTEISSSNSSNIRAGSHSDYGSATLLFQKDVAGLQVLMNDEWIDIPPKDGSLVVNIGDAMEFWTSGFFKSTQHRVALPTTEAESASRFSMAFFLQPDEDCVLEPLPIKRKGVDGSEEEERLDRIRFQEVLKRKGISEDVKKLTGGEHLRARLRATYG